MPQKIVLFGGKLMGHWAGICLKFFLSKKITLKGEENIIKEEKFFIAASQYQNQETFLLCLQTSIITNIPCERRFCFTKNVFSCSKKITLYTINE